MKNPNFSLGIDLARMAKHKAVLAQTSDPFETCSKSSFSFEQNLEGLNALCDYVKKRTGEDTLENVAVNMEPTSGAYKVVGAFLKMKGASVYTTRCDIVASMRRVQSKFVKNDRMDARVISKIVYSLPEKLNALVFADSRIETLRILSTERQTVVETLTAEKLRLLARLEPVWRELIKGLSREQRFSLVIRKFFAKFSDPRKVIKYGEARFREWFIKNFHGNTSIKLFAKIWLCSERASELFDLFEQNKALNMNWEIFQFSIDHHFRVIGNLEKELKIIDKKIKEARKNIPECDLLQEIPGVGDVVSVTLAAVLMPTKRFSSIEKFSGYTGLIPRIKGSGNHEICGLNITKAGNRNLKRDLVLAADTAMYKDPQLARFAISMLIRGKHYNEVRVAVGRKTGERAFSLLKRVENGEKNVHYEYRDLTGARIAKREANGIAATLWQNYREAKNKSSRKSDGNMAV
jgi:transposase